MTETLHDHEHPHTDEEATTEEAPPIFTPPAEWQVNVLRQHLANVNDQRVEAEMATTFQAEIIAAQARQIDYLSALAFGVHSHESDEGTFHHSHEAHTNGTEAHEH